MTTTISRLTVPLIDELIRLMDRGAPYVQARSASDYWAYATLFASTCPVAHVDGELAGAVIAFRSQDDPREVYVQDVMVHPDHRRKGVTTVLLDSVRAQAQEWQCTRLWLTSEPDNRTADSAWRALGWTNVPGDLEIDGIQVISDFKGLGKHRAVYELPLTSAGTRSVQPPLNAVMPTLALRVRWDDLELRLPDDVELLALADLAADGVHNLDDTPFSQPWARGNREDVQRNVLAHQWKNRARTAVDDWALSLGVFRDGEIVGEQQVSAKDFQITRSGHTGSWLGLRHHSQGVGTRMRLMALHLAFEGLDATEMLSDAYDDNPASNAVSRRLGYTANGSQTTVRGQHPAVENGYRMSRELWDARPDNLRPEITLDGVSSVRKLFGIDQPGL